MNILNAIWDISTLEGDVVEKDHVESIKILQKHCFGVDLMCWSSMAELVQKHFVIIMAGSRKDRLSSPALFHDSFVFIFVVA